MFSFVFIISLGVVFADHLENDTFSPPWKTSGRTFRILGGHIVDIEEYPYQVSLQLYGRHFCGGSILSDKYILTAAHCVYNERNIEMYQIRYGSNYSDRGGKFAAIIRIVRHHKFDYKLYDYDIAIVELSKCLVFDAKCQPIRLPEGGQVNADGTLLTVSGYGIYTEQDYDHKLRAVKVPKANHALCGELYVKWDIVISPRMICAGYEKGGKDACGGDSGGPLVVGDTQVGIVSFGPSCAPNELPGVYMSIATFRCWILEHAGV